MGPRDALAGGDGEARTLAALTRPSIAAAPQLLFHADLGNVPQLDDEEEEDTMANVKLLPAQCQIDMTFKELRLVPLGAIGSAWVVPLRSIRSMQRPPGAGAVVDVEVAEGSGQRVADPPGA